MKHKIKRTKKEEKKKRQMQQKEWVSCGRGLGGGRVDVGRREMMWRLADEGHWAVSLCRKL